MAYAKYAALAALTVAALATATPGWSRLLDPMNHPNRKDFLEQSNQDEDKYLSVSVERCYPEREERRSAYGVCNVFETRPGQTLRQVLNNARSPYIVNEWDNFRELNGWPESLKPEHRAPEKWFVMIDHSREEADRRTNALLKHFGYSN